MAHIYARVYVQAQAVQSISQLCRAPALASPLRPATAMRQRQRTLPFHPETSLCATPHRHVAYGIYSAGLYGRTSWGLFIQDLSSEMCLHQAS